MFKWYNSSISSWQDTDGKLTYTSLDHAELYEKFDVSLQIPFWIKNFDFDFIDV